MNAQNQKPPTSHTPNHDPRLCRSIPPSLSSETSSTVMSHLSNHPSQATGHARPALPPFSTGAPSPAMTAPPNDTYRPESIWLSSPAMPETQSDKNKHSEGGHFQKYSPYNPWKTHTRKILLACSLIIIPMAIFTAVLIWIVFAHDVSAGSCPYQDLCPGPNLVDPVAHDYYYIDFSAPRLAFVSSWSSTVSFALIGALMTLYSYSTAKNFLRSSQRIEKSESPLSTFHFHILIRALNGELLLLWDLSTRKLKDIFWRNQVSHTRKEQVKMPIILRTSISVLFLGMLSSILIQIADTYLHITTNTVNAVQYHALEESALNYSRGISPSCLQLSGIGTRDNVNFWSCSYYYLPQYNALEFSELAALSSFDGNLSLKHAIFEFEDTEKVRYAIVGPPTANTLDFKASSFGVSTQCSAIPAKACNVSALGRLSSPINWPFNCSSKLGGIDLQGNLSAFRLDWHVIDAHRYLRDDEPFSGTRHGINNTAILNATVNESNTMFRNPWHWVVQVNLGSAKYSSQSRLDLKANPYLLREPVQDPVMFILLYCKSTVWDVTYTAIGHQITGIERTKSNSSTAGIVSTTSYSRFGESHNLLGEVVQKILHANADGRKITIDDFVRIISLIFSKKLAIPLATQLSGRPALLAQERTSPLVTKLPVSALWFLVFANLLYIVFGIILTVFALFATSAGVHQVHTRLSIAGLVAELFEKPYSTRAVPSGSDLFESSDGDIEVKNSVEVRMMSTGGSEFILCKQE